MSSSYEAGARDPTYNGDGTPADYIAHRRRQKKKRGINQLATDREFDWKRSEILIQGRQFKYRDFRHLMYIQRGKCAVCHRLIDWNATVDHDHATREVRGLVHKRCNQLIGYCDEDIAILQGAIDYLSKFI